MIIFLMIQFFDFNCLGLIIEFSKSSVRKNCSGFSNDRMAHSVLKISCEICTLIKQCQGIKHVESLCARVLGQGKGYARIIRKQKDLQETVKEGGNCLKILEKCCVS